MKRDSQGARLVANLPALRSYVRRLVSDRQLAREILQEVSVRVLSGRGPDEPDRFLAWCFGIARHVLAHDWRMRKRAAVELPLEGDAEDELFAADVDREGHVDARAWMARLLLQIDGDELALLVRRYVLEETGRELADDLEQSSASMRMRLMRLRSTLSARGPGR